MKVLPTPTGPTMVTWRRASRKRSETELLEQLAIEGDVCRGVPGLELHLRIELSTVGPQGGGLGVAA